jgi:hypothetical protein
MSGIRGRQRLSSVFALGDESVYPHSPNDATDDDPAAIRGQQVNGLRFEWRF